MFAKILDWFGYGNPNAVAAGRGGHNHSHGEGGHGHTHGVIDATIASTSRGIWAIKWSFIILAATSVMQLFVVWISSSVALFADTIHNIGDAGTAIPLWIAFLFARRKPSARFPYGYGRVEDIAGVIIVLIILLSAVIAGNEAISRLINPQPINNLLWVGIAGVVGFIGNEVVAVLRIRVGREINSAALVADGYHARTDGLTSLAVVLGAVGVWAGFPLADPIIGLLITVAILGIVWQSARSVFTRMLDGLEAGTLEEIRHAAEHVEGATVTDVKARWHGHKLHAELAIRADDKLPLGSALKIADDVRRSLFEHLSALSVANVRFARRTDETDLPEPLPVPVSGRAGGHGHHHAPEPLAVSSRLATGTLSIVDTLDGERLEFRIDKHAENLTASVHIDRNGGRVEVHGLRPVIGDHHRLQSISAPEEPHEFTAKLLLVADERHAEIPFTMKDPNTHAH